jgi:4-diphosphocytidyl-2-C-methyl-D-erythritol kinase
MSASTTKIRLLAPAKINLWLRVLGKREDGFHAVETRLCPLSLADIIELERGTGAAGIVCQCSDVTLPTDDSNLAVRALRLFEEHTQTRSAWRLGIEKHIPHGAGLGGGSSDAASTLLAANHLFGQPLSLEHLSHIAASIGSDVPFFLHDGPCDATGRGEIITPVAFPWRISVVLIKPPFGIPTPWAYQRWAASQPLKGVLYAPQLCAWGAMANDLERPVFEKHLLLPTLKTWLLDQPETHAALMSGSGSTMFAIAHSASDAEALAERAQEFCGATAWVKVAHVGV